MRGCRNKRIVTILLLTILVINIFFVTNVNAAVTVDDIELPDLDIEFSSENFGFLNIDLDGLENLSSLDDLDSLSQLDSSLGELRSIDTLSDTADEPMRAADSDSPSLSLDSGLFSDTSLDAMINLDDLTTTVDLDIDTASLLNLDINEDSLDLNIDLSGTSSLDINISSNNNQDEPEPANEPEMFDPQDFIDLINNFGAFLNNLAQLGGNSSTELNTDLSDNQLSAFLGSDLAASSLESDDYASLIDNPDTGDEIAIYFAILVVSGIGLIFIRKYKK